MPQRSIRGRPKRLRRRRGSANTTTAPVNTVLKDIRELEKTQIRGSLPQVRDPTALSIRNNKVHSFSRSFSAGSVLFNPGIDQSGAVSVTLAGFVSATEFTNLFDSYRFAQLTVQFIPTASMGGILYSVLDYDDSNVLVGLPAVLEYDTLHIVQGGQMQTRVFTPRVALAAFGQSVFTSFAQRSLVWIDTASPNVPHYGVKWFFPAVAGIPSSSAYQIIVTCVLQCRNPR